jgi:hypothetical protein
MADRITVWRKLEQHCGLRSICFLFVVVWVLVTILFLFFLRMEKLHANSPLDESGAPSISPTASPFYYV